jgi:hypothetical protein
MDWHPWRVCCGKKLLSAYKRRQKSYVLVAGIVICNALAAPMLVATTVAS